MERGIRLIAPSATDGRRDSGQNFAPVPRIDFDRWNAKRGKRGIQPALPKQCRSYNGVADSSVS